MQRHSAARSRNQKTRMKIPARRDQGEKGAGTANGRE